MRKLVFDHTAFEDFTNWAGIDRFTDSPQTPSSRKLEKGVTSK